MGIIEPDGILNGSAVGQGGIADQHGGLRKLWWRLQRNRPQRCRQWSVRPVGQELAAHRDADAVALGVRLALQVHVEIDRAHDAVAELLVDQGLEGAAVDADQFVEAVDQRIGRHGGGQAVAAATA